MTRAAARCFLALIAVTSIAMSDPPVPPAPVARIEPVTDVYFGDRVVDPYRWMENDQDPAWLPFLRGQNAHARAVLEALPQRAALLRRIRALSVETDVADVQRAGGRVFFQQRPPGANNYQLYVASAGGAPRLLIDPTHSDSAHSHLSLDWWHASPDGSKVVFGMSADGSENSVLQILDVGSGEIAPERIPDTEMAHTSWLEDGSGFFYTQLTGKVGSPLRYLNARARLHRLGTDPKSDPVVMERGKDPRVSFEKIQVPTIHIESGSDQALLILADVRNEFRLLVAPLAAVLAGHAQWQPVAGFADEITGAQLIGDALYLLANRDHPRGRVLRTLAHSPDLGTATEVVPETGLVLEDIAAAQDGLYIQAMDGGLARLQRLAPDGRLTQIPLPFDGTLSALAADQRAPGVTVALSGWLTPTNLWSTDPAGRVINTQLIAQAPLDLSPYTTERRFATARDGVQIPYTLIYRKGLQRDGNRPVFMSAYGSYGYAYTPKFAGRLLALVDQGFIVGVANVRGGGEYGRSWHRAGQLENKPNTWRDLIAVAEDLIAQHYTRTACLAIGGRSAGGITVGRAITERPDLFAAAISGVGWHNPLRYVAEQNSYGEEPEWGAIDDPAGYRALKSIDSYQAVIDHTPYPAVLLTTGVTDPRVAPFHPAKMAARLQAATTSDRPVLLRVDFDAGHGIGSTRVQQDSEAVDTYAFLIAQTAAH